MKSLCWTILVLLITSGCSDEGKTVAQSAGSRVGETLTDFASGIGEGVDRRMEVTVELSPQCGELGLSKTVAKSLGLAGGKNLDLKSGITVYIIAEQPFTGQLVCKAINKEGDEVGRSKVDVEFEADDAQYVNFSFDSEMDSQLTEKYLVDAREQPKAERDATAEESTQDTTNQDQ